MEIHNEIVSDYALLEPEVFCICVELDARVCSDLLFAVLLGEIYEDVVVEWLDCERDDVVD